MARSIRLAAPAKVNLTLEVLGRRPDGYHEIASVMALIGLADRVRVTGSRSLTVRTHPPVDAPPGEELAERAVRLIAGAADREPRAHISIDKRIPVAAGLGGGSSDAAAVLRGLAALWRAPSLELLRMAAQVGSDVPFFASGLPVAVVRGRGDLVEPLPPPAEPLWIVLVTVRARLRTADVFGALDRGERSDGRATARAAALFRSGRASGAELRTIARNDLLGAAERACPALREAREVALVAGVTLALSGSGPSLFAMADDRAHALRIARALRRRGLRARPLPMAIDFDPGR